jgi:predicted LPLAT superfamily acyltransferase
LSYVLKAPVILCFALHKRSQQYEVYFEEIAGPPASRDDEALREWTQHYVDRLEYHARNAPYNWFNFYDYWQDNEESSSS